jgi:hypothetical protein
MTDVQQKAVAAGFLHALQVTPALYQEWQGIAKDNYAAIGALIQKTMGLATAPSADDLHAMAAYIDAHLQAQVAQMQEADPNAPRHVGYLVLTTQG